MRQARYHSLCVLLMLAALIAGPQLKAQNPSYCHFTPKKGDKGYMSYGDDQRAAGTNYTIRIWVHVIRETNGTGGQSDAEVTQALDIMEQDYTPHGICFVEVGRSEIWQSGLSVGSLSSLLTTHGHSDAIDCFLLPDNIPGGGGLASGIPGEGFTVGGVLFGVDMVTSHVISHEMGHCMGLWHTHQSGTPSCPEFVNGTNCTTCGDFVCDTPADPHLGFNVDQTTCLWLGSGTDPNGDPYAPDPANIMAYTQPVCMQYFTNGQGLRMRTAIANEPILQAVCVPDYAYRQNGSISSGGEVVTGFIEVAAGSNVDTGQPSGPYSVTGSAVVEYVANIGGRVTLAPGFTASPGAGGSFTARIEDFCASNGGMRLAPNTGNPTASSAGMTRPEPSSGEAFHSPDRMHLEAYPNPFGQDFFLELGLPATAVVDISVFNVVGQRIQTVAANKEMTAGQHVIGIDATGLDEGIYLVRVVSGKDVIVKRMLKRKLND